MTRPSSLAMQRYSIEPRTRKLMNMLKDIGFCHLPEIFLINIENNY